MWKDYPIDDVHPRAAKIAEAAHCAEEHGKYWEFHDVVFARQSAAANAPLEEYARAVDLQGTDFTADGHRAPPGPARDDVRSIFLRLVCAALWGGVTSKPRHVT